MRGRGGGTSNDVRATSSNANSEPDATETNAKLLSEQGNQSTRVLHVARCAKFDCHVTLTMLSFVQNIIFLPRRYYTHPSRLDT